MFKDLEKVSKNVSDSDDMAMNYYLMTLSSVITKSSFFAAETILVDPLPVGANITIRASQKEYSYNIYKITPSSRIVYKVEDFSDTPVVSQLAGKCAPIAYLLEIDKGTSDTEVISSSTYALKNELASLLAEGAGDWYISDFLKMPLLSSSIRNDDIYCLACMTPIGPISGLAYSLNDELPRGLIYIHLINTSLHLEGRGLASKLYHGISKYCLENDFWLCRGEPSASTRLQGYVDRGHWLKDHYPEMGIVEHQKRKMIGELIQNNLTFSEPGAHELLPYLEDVINAYTEGPGGKEIGSEQAMTALSYMTVSEIKEWRSPWA